MKSCGISGRLTDLRKCFLHQCAHWLRKPISGAQVAGNDESSTKFVKGMNLLKRKNKSRNKFVNEKRAGFRPRVFFVHRFGHAEERVLQDTPSA